MLKIREIRSGMNFKKEERRKEYKRLDMNSTSREKNQGESIEFSLSCEGQNIITLNRPSG